MRARIKNGSPNVSSLSVGKEYDVKEVIEETKDYGKLFVITDDRGQEIACLEEDCAFLDAGQWEIIE